MAVRPGDAVAPPRVAASVADLAALATAREVINPSDGKSGSTFERLEIGGQRLLLKSVGYRSDWIMRVTDDRDLRTLKIWRAGIFARAATVVDHTVEAMAADGDGEDAVLGVLMRDVSETLVPEGDSVVPLETHRAFLDALAALSALFWGWRDELGLTPMARRFRFFAPDVLASEVARPDAAFVPVLAAGGWRALAERDAETSRVAHAVQARAAALAGALATTPATFLHGDWKFGNLGRHADGRVVLLDWAYPGSGPVGWDLGWYLALNAARLPESKEDAIAAFAESLRRHGIDTGEWFDVQLHLCLLGVTATFGWEKALGDDAELEWWAGQAHQGARLLDDLAPGWR